ncbi:porin family protein [Belliella sp. DSM 107340]|uniref:Porin family protein n=1 Tax=Belliella calami TaxID=2923436 RepID=A0ABS9UQP2_9BACT|nr:porin family protein [Belliella calami]MCH7398848.1 porin family protein [Belliella calami]
MKKYLAIILFTLISILSFGQSNYQDVVYLKDGNVVRGVIIEQVPNTSIRIQTPNRSVFFFEMDEIEKLTKEKGSTNFDKRRGYIGLTIGPSFPLGDFGDPSNGLAKTGLQINLVNFGYLFSDNFGIAGSWFGAANPIDANGIDPWSYGGLMIGPLLSLPVSETVDFDFKPMIGYAATTIPNVGSGTQTSASYAYSLGTQVRIHVGPKFSLIISADYFSTKPEFENYNVEQKIGTINLGFGGSFRLR